MAKGKTIEIKKVSKLEGLKTKGVTRIGEDDTGKITGKEK